MFSKRLKNLTPYVPGEQPQDRNYIKLNTNENPYPPAPSVQEYLKSIDIDALRRYPDPDSKELCKAISRRYHIKPGEVFVGNGSDEVLSFIFYAFFDSAEHPIFFPRYTYSFYPVYCDYYNIEYVPVPLEDDYSISLERFLTIGPSSGIIFPNPNAPTGMGISLSSIYSFLSSYPREYIVVIDEAYVDFGGESALPLIREFENLIIVRTFSKSFSLAGARLGFAVSNERLICALKAVKDSFNSYPVNSVTQKIGIIAINEDAYYHSITQKVIETRTRLITELNQLNWYVLPSSANFVFAKKNGIKGVTVYSELKENGILVRYFDIDGLKDFVRITIGDETQMKHLIDVIKSCF